MECPLFQAEHFVDAPTQLQRIKSSRPKKRLQSEADKTEASLYFSIHISDQPHVAQLADLNQRMIARPS